MKVVEVDSPCNEWDLFVQSSTIASAYHCFGWKKVFENSFQHKCYYFAAIDDDNSWQGILPLVHLRSMLFGNFLVSLPFVNYGGLLSNGPEAAKKLIAEAEKLRSACGATHIELRHISCVCANLPTKRHKVTMVLELLDCHERQWAAFDSKLRNQIRKSQKNGLRFQLGRVELLSSFYDVFSRNMRDLGTPVYSKRFFSNVLEAFPTSTMIGIVFHDERAIAAGLISWFKNRMEVPWASSIREYNALCPNHLLYWELMQFAIGKGLTQFDFGRSTPNEGTYNFKKQWGALPLQLNWQYVMDAGRELPDISPHNPKYELAIRAWQRLPLAISKALGPHIVRNIP